MSNFIQPSLFNGDSSDKDETKSTAGKAKNKAKPKKKPKLIVEEVKEATIVIREIEPLPTLEIPGVKVIRDAFLSRHFQQINWGSKNPGNTTEELLFSGCVATLEHCLFLHQHNIWIPPEAIIETGEGDKKREKIDFDAIAVRHHLVFEDKITATIDFGKVLIFLRPGALVQGETEFSICGGDMLIGQVGMSAIIAFDAPAIEVSL